MEGLCLETMEKDNNAQHTTNALTLPNKMITFLHKISKNDTWMMMPWMLNYKGFGPGVYKDCLARTLLDFCSRVVCGSRVLWFLVFSSHLIKTLSPSGNRELEAWGNQCMLASSGATVFLPLRFWKEGKCHT